MKLATFLKSKTGVLVIACIVIVLVALIGIAARLSAFVLLTIVVLLVIGTAVALAWAYHVDKGFYGDLEDLSQSTNQAYQLHSLVQSPKNPQQEIVADALYAMGSGAAREVIAVKEEMESYREYSESWVHEAKTPLAAALLISDRVPEPEATQLKRELDRAAQEIETALWYTRCLNPQEDYLIREISLAELARQACKDNARFLIEQQVSPCFEIDENLKVFTDSKQVIFIISQAVVNGAKYGATTLRFSADVITDDAGTQRVDLNIQDDGHGIAASDVPRVFQKGFTGSHGRENGNSTGMGLYLAAKLSKGLGLGLSLSSEEAVGTCVTLSFPLDRRRLDAQEISASF